MHGNQKTDYGAEHLCLSYGLFTSLMMVQCSIAALLLSEHALTQPSDRPLELMAFERRASLCLNICAPCRRWRSGRHSR